MTKPTKLQADWLDSSPTRKVVAALEAKRPGCARFVGGCVRNTLMERIVDDLDIATQLTPDEVLEGLNAAGIRAEPTGIEHGTITAICDHVPYEITSLRRDVETDGRRAVVAFTTDWSEDAQRRDFRLNAIYASPDGTLHDPTRGGLDDAATGRVIFIGDADQRLIEDYLRMLRFFRFNAWYGAGIDPEGLAACKRQVGGLRKIAVERIWREMYKLLKAPKLDETIWAMDEAGVLDAIFPHRRTGDAAEHISRLQILESKVDLLPDPDRRLMALLPRDYSVVAAIARHLRLPNKDRDRLIAWANDEISVASVGDPKSERVSLYRYGAEALIDWAMYEDRAEDVRRLKAAGAPPVFPVLGRDLLEVGFEAGARVGETLRALEALWIDGDFKADRQALLAVARERL
ncbi:MAG: CCA tRNA nucleotidyltransferase [Pseudomonadota bacterium]